MSPWDARRTASAHKRKTEHTGFLCEMGLCVRWEETGRGELERRDRRAVVRSRVRRDLVRRRVQSVRGGGGGSRVRRDLVRRRVQSVREGGGGGVVSVATWYAIAHSHLCTTCPPAAPASVRCVSD